MQNHLKLRAVGFFLCALALTAAHHKSATVALMVNAANRFVESLNTRFQRPMTVFKFDAADRTNWHYFPEGNFTQTHGYERNGITFAEMDAKQQHLAHGLLSTGLSKTGYAKAVDVMALEDIVRVIEADTTGHRDTQGFHFTIFGEPSLTAIWGWRVEGHHLSLHYTIENGKLVSASPTFFGANPHEVAQGPHKGMRALADEEDLALALLQSLGPEKQKRAVFSDVAPFDILTMAHTRAELEGEPQGLPASEMNETEYGMLLALIDEYAGNVPSDVAARRMKAARDTPRDELLFAWAGRIGRPKAQEVVVGSLTTGNREVGGNYYRVQAPTFLIEYDNTQNQSNHSHSVWRDFEGDFGLDVLALHHRQYDHGISGRQEIAAD